MQFVLQPPRSQLIEAVIQALLRLLVQLSIVTECIEYFYTLSQFIEPQLKSFKQVKICAFNLKVRHHNKLLRQLLTKERLQQLGLATTDIIIGDVLLDDLLQCRGFTLLAWSIHPCRILQKLVVDASLSVASAIRSFDHSLDQSDDDLDVVELDLDSGNLAFKRSVHLLDHRHRGEGLLDLVDGDDELLVELGGELRWTLLEEELLLEVLLEVGVHLRRAHLVHLFGGVRQVPSVRQNVVLLAHFARQWLQRFYVAALSGFLTVQEHADVMFNEFLTVATRCPINENPVSDLHFFRQETIDLQPVIATVNLLLLETIIHFELLNLVIKRRNDALEFIVLLLESTLVRHHLQGGVEKLIAVLAVTV